MRNEKIDEDTHCIFQKCQRIIISEGFRRQISILLRKLSIPNQLGNKSFANPFFLDIDLIRINSTDQFILALMEQIMQTALTKWYIQKLRNDFLSFYREELIRLEYALRQVFYVG